MFGKKFTIILFILAFMLSISAVNAADTNATDDIAAIDVDEEPPSGEVILSSTENDSVTASKLESSLSGADFKMYYKDGSSYDVTLLDDNNKPVKDALVVFSLGTASYNRTTNANGVASLLINLNAGSYQIKASSGDLSVVNKITVLPVIKGTDIVKTYKSSTPVSATFLNNNGKALKNTDVNFKIGSKTYAAKTNTKGVASVNPNLAVGKYKVYAIHPNGFKLALTLSVRNSISSKDLTKHYMSSSHFKAKFYGKNGKVLSKTYIKFQAKGVTYNVKTSANGIAKLKIISTPSSFDVVSINPSTGEKRTNKVTILSTLSASSMSVFAGDASKFKVKLYKDEKLVKNALVYVYISGFKHIVQTDANGIATVDFNLKTAGTYTFKSVDPYTGYSINTKIVVKLPTIKASDLITTNKTDVTYKVTVLKSNGKVSPNVQVSMTIQGKTYDVKSNANGVASLTLKLPVGKYSITIKDLTSGYSIAKTITVREYMKYNQYGVSADGLTILAIGRPSSALDKYDYTFYKTEFDRTCTYCGGHNLYWSIFWAGNEYTDYGRFPATGNMEGGSAEGIILCADCDCDWSVFGNNHGDGMKSLTIVTPTVHSTKEEAYKLKNGQYN